MFIVIVFWNAKQKMWVSMLSDNIPETASDVPGMGSFFQQENSSNFTNTRDRVIALGFGVIGGGSGGAECRFVCGEESCTLTCRIE